MIRPLFQLTAAVIALFRCSLEHFLLLVQHISIVPLLPLKPQKCQSECGTDNYVFTRAAQLSLCASEQQEQSTTRRGEKKNQSWLDSFGGRRRRWDRDRCATSRPPRRVCPPPGLCAPTAWSTRATGSAASTSTIRPIQRGSTTTLPPSLPVCSGGHPSGGKSWSWQSKTNQIWLRMQCAWVGQEKRGKMQLYLSIWSEMQKSKQKQCPFCSAFSAIIDICSLSPYSFPRIPPDIRVRVYLQVTQRLIEHARCWEKHIPLHNNHKNTVSICSARATASPPIPPWPKASRVPIRAVSLRVRPWHGWITALCKPGSHGTSDENHGHQPG